MGLSENVIRKGFQFLPDDCVAAVTVAVAAYRRRKQIIKNTNQLALVLGLLDEEDAVVSRENICMYPLKRASRSNYVLCTDY